MSTFIDAETMRPKWSDGTIDRRGTPIGDKVETWQWDRMVYPGRKQQGRRVREHIKVMRCPEGWYSDSGGPDEPSGGAICGTLLDPTWRNSFGGLDRDEFNGYHDEHPVVWTVKVKRYTKRRTMRYCDPELPTEFRPQLASNSASTLDT